MGKYDDLLEPVAGKYSDLLEAAPPSGKYADLLEQPAPSDDPYADVIPGAMAQGQPATMVAPPVPSTPPGISPVDLIKRAGAGIAENTALVAQGAMTADALLSGVGVPSITGTITGIPVQKAEPFARDFSQTVQERARGAYGVDPDRDKQLVSKIVGGATSLLPVLASGPAAPYTAALLLGESVKQDAVAHGATEGQQTAAFASGAVVGLASELLLGLPVLLRSAKAAGADDAAIKSMTRKVIEQGVKNSGREATQEAIEQTSQNLIANTFVGYDPTRKTTENVGEAALVGGIIGGPVGGVVQVASSLDAAAAQKAVDNEAAAIKAAAEVGATQTAQAAAGMVAPLPIDADLPEASSALAEVAAIPAGIGAPVAPAAAFEMETTAPPAPLPPTSTPVAQTPAPPITAPVTAPGGEPSVLDLKPRDITAERRAELRAAVEAAEAGPQKQTDPHPGLTFREITSQRLPLIASRAKGKVKQLPTGYVKRGDLYVYEGQPTSEPETGTPNEPAQVVGAEARGNQALSPGVATAGAEAGAAVAPSRRSSSAMGIVAPNLIAELVGKNARRLFTAEGDLPKTVFADWIKREGRVAREAKEVQFAVRDLYREVAKSANIGKAKSLVKGFSSVPTIMVRNMNNALAGDTTAMASLPINVQAAVAKMRQHIDLMSEEMIRKGLVDADLAAVITGNQGSYLTRTYKIFDQGEKWVKSIPPEVFNRARTFLQREIAAKKGTATVEDGDRLLRNMLADWVNEGSAPSKRGGKLGAKDLSSFIKRQNIAPELRAVMGENTNIIANYATTASKIARFISDQEFLSSVKSKGLGKFLFESEDAPAGFNSIIAAEESATMSPLNGLRTTPEIAQAFSEFGKTPGDPGILLRSLRWLNLVSKGTKTVGSVLTQARNLTGQPFFFTMNGHYDMRPLRDAFKAVGADLGIGSDAAARALVKDAAAHGLVGENAYAGEFREAFKQAMLFAPEDVPDAFANQFVGTRLAGKAIKGAERLYQATDELGKIVGWFNEQKRVREMNPGMLEPDVKRTASDRVRLTYPTYSMSPTALKSFRQQPFFGPFATFWYESYRTTFHNIRIGLEDIKGSTPAHKRAGAERLAGSMIVLAVAGYGAQAITRAMLGLDRKEDEDVRRMLPPWSQNSQLAYLGKGNGKYDFVNMSYANPYSTLTDPLIGVLSSLSRGEDADQAFGRGLSEVFAPLTNEQITSGAFVDLMRNQTKTGGRVYNPQSPWEIKGPEMLKHVTGATFLPGTLDRVKRRIIPAIKGETTAYGRSLNPAKEISAEFTGIRFESMDVGQAIQFKAKKFVSAENDAEAIFRSVATRAGTVANDEIANAYKTSEQSRFQLWQELHRDLMAAQRSGVSLSEAKTAMKSRRIPSSTVDAVAAGRYVPYSPSSDVIATARKNGRALPMIQMRSATREIPKALTDVR